MIFLRSMCENTMNAFIGLLMWFGECFLVWKKKLKYYRARKNGQLQFDLWPLAPLLTPGSGPNPLVVISGEKKTQLFSHSLLPDILFLSSFVKMHRTQKRNEAMRDNKNC